jgi:MOSC domain-containing protein YiiM
VVAGLDLRRLERGTRLRVGPVVFEVSGPRPPCGYLERLSGPGIARALRRDAGICLRAVSGGIIRCGDPVIPD